MAGIHGSKFDRCTVKERSRRTWEREHQIKTKICIHCKKRRIDKRHHLYCSSCWIANQVRKGNIYKGE